MKHRRSSRSSRRRQRRGPTRVRRLAVAGLGLVLSVLLVRALVVTTFSIPSVSMANTLRVGDRIMVDRVTYQLRDVQRGDVVVFDGTDSFGAVDGASGAGSAWLVDSVASAVGAVRPGRTTYVKRVIGVGGDRVACCDSDGRITVNGRAVDEQQYLHPGDDPSQLQFHITVPPGRLWMMGDYRSHSSDSRAHLAGPGGGTVEEEDVIGRVIGVVWPVGRFGGVR